VAVQLPEDAVVVVLLPDSGKSYLSSLYNDEWMQEKGLLEQNSSSINQYARTDWMQF